MKSQITELLSGIQDRLAEKVPALLSIEKNYGQLDFETPPVKWPCALLDFEEVDYSMAGRGSQMANISVAVIVADSRREDVDRTADYETINLLEDVNDALRLFTTGTFAPLWRKNVRKVTVNQTMEAYEITFESHFVVDGITEQTVSKLQSVKLDIAVKK